MVLGAGREGKCLSQGAFDCNWKEERNQGFNEANPSRRCEKKPEVLAQSILYSSWKNKRRAIKPAEPKLRAAPRRS